MRPEGDPEDLRREIRELEVRITALRQEKEEVARIARAKPKSFRVQHAILVSARVVLLVIGIASILALLWFLLLNIRLPR